MVAKASFGKISSLIKKPAWYKLIQNEFETDAFKVVAAGLIKLTFRSPNKTSVVYHRGIGEGVNCGKEIWWFRFIYG